MTPRQPTERERARMTQDNQRRGRGRAWPWRKRRGRRGQPTEYFEIANQECFSINNSLTAYITFHHNILYLLFLRFMLTI